MSNVLSSILDLLEVDFMSFLASKASLLSNETAKSDEGLFWKSSLILVWDIMHIESNLKHQYISFKYNIYLSSQALNGFWYTTKTVQYKRIFFLSKYVYVRTPFDIDDNSSGLESYAMSGNIFTKRVHLVF